MNQRFTIDGSEPLEASLAECCERVSRGVLEIIPRSRVRALLLGGGYGRGEGGVLQTDSGQRPYNDLEFYILLSGSNMINQMRFHRRIEALARELTRIARLEIEFKLLSHSSLERSPVTMFYYDLITGHRLVFGAESWLLRCQHHRAAHRIPMHEATRLLMNRCSGLLYSQAKLQSAVLTPEDADFVGRNLAKAKLALGDVILAMRGQYHSSCRERHKRLRKLEADGLLQSFSSVLPLHAQGVEFKLHPVRSTRSVSDFRAELEFLKEIAGRLWLCLEQHRLGRSFSNLLSYSLESGAICPESNRLKNRLINAQRFGILHFRDTTYPRERLLRTLPLLLWHPETIREPGCLRFLQHELHSSASSYSGLVADYNLLWRCYN